MISAETALVLESKCDLRRLRVLARGQNARVAQELLDIRDAAMRYEPGQLPSGAEAEADPAEAGPGLEQWLSVLDVADLLCITDSAVRLACRQGRIKAERVGRGPWQITEKAYEDFRDSRET